MFNRHFRLYSGDMTSKIETRRKTTSCGTLVYRLSEVSFSECEVLLVKQFSDSNTWGVPKGHMNESETVEETAARETREEAGIEVILEDRLPDTSITYRDEDKTVVTFMARQACDREPSSCDPESEVADVRWFKVNDLPRIHQYQRTLVEDGINRLYARCMRATLSTGSPKDA